MSSQLPLGLRLRASARFSGFVAGPNGELLARLQELAQSPHESFLLCWGRPGSGKTHLLQACCHHAASQAHPAMYLDLQQPGGPLPGWLEGLEQYSLVCLDNIQAVAGEAVMEEAAFHLYNRCRQQGVCLVASADCAPVGLPVVLPDLRSRLGWGLTYQIHPLDDPQLLQVLKLKASQRGCELPEETGRYLIRRVSREPSDLVRLVDRLDELSLAEQRRLTVPFVKQALSL